MSSSGSIMAWWGSRSNLPVTYPSIVPQSARHDWHGSEMRPMGLCKHGCNRFRVLGHDGDRALPEVVVFLWANSDRLVDRCCNVAGADLAVLDRLTIIRCRAMDRSAADSTAGERTGPGTGEVVATHVLVDLGRAAKLA